MVTNPFKLLPFVVSPISSCSIFPRNASFDYPSKYYFPFPLRHLSLIALHVHHSNQWQFFWPFFVGLWAYLVFLVAHHFERSNQLIYKICRNQVCFCLFPFHITAEGTSGHFLGDQGHQQMVVEDLQMFFVLIGKKYKIIKKHLETKKFL